MPINIEEVKTEAKQQLHDEAFEMAVEHEKERIKAKRQHFLPWKVKFRNPVTFHDHYTGKKV